MLELHDNDTGALIGSATPEQVQFLIDNLEETHSGDQDYYIDEPTLELLEDSGADPALIDLLRGALADREGFEVRWSDPSGG